MEKSVFFVLPACKALPCLASPHQTAMKQLVWTVWSKSWRLSRRTFFRVRKKTTMDRIAPRIPMASRQIPAINYGG